MLSQAFLPGMRVKRRMTLQGTVYHYIHIREPVSTIGDLHHGKVWFPAFFLCIYGRLLCAEQEQLLRGSESAGSIQPACKQTEWTEYQKQMQKRETR